MLVRVRLGGWGALMASVGIKRYGTGLLCSSGLWYAACDIVRFGILSSMVLLYRVLLVLLYGVFLHGVLLYGVLLVQGVTVYGVLGRSLAITRHHPH